MNRELRLHFFFNFYAPLAFGFIANLGVFLVSEFVSFVFCIKRGYTMIIVLIVAILALLILSLLTNIRQVLHHDIYLTDRVPVNVKIVNCMTIGPPGVGKTTLKQQLLSTENSNNSTPFSTPVAKVEKIGLQSPKKNKAKTKWTLVSSDEEILAQLKCLPIYRKIKIITIVTTLINLIVFFIPLGLMLSGTFISNSYQNIALSPPFASQNDLVNTLRVGHDFIHLMVLAFIFFGLILMAMVILGYFSKNKIDLMRVENRLIYIERRELPTPGTLIINFWDSGGQPEFHEVLPALVPQPTLFLVMFDMSKGLDEQYTVTYKASDDDISEPYQSSFSNCQFLLQALASIKSTGKQKYPESVVKEKKGIFKYLTILSQIFPSWKKVLEEHKCNTIIIGTHKDKLTQAQINKLQHELKTAIKGTDWYRSNMIIPTSDGHLMLPINSFDKEDIECVKDMISQAASNSEGTDIEINWLSLKFAIQKSKKLVMTLAECKKLATDECKIYTVPQEGDENILHYEFKAALWFLHHITGSIRYFENVPEVKDIVITDPLLLFDLVSELIVSTFTFPSVRSTHDSERFRSSGRFLKHHLKNCTAVKDQLLTEDQIIAILTHLNVIAPVGVNDNEEEEYFLPCVLVHAPKPSTDLPSPPHGYSPLLITFKCGYTPRGMFSCLIAHILTTSKGKWVLASDEIFRDQVQFRMKTSGHIVVIKNCLKYLEVLLIFPHGSTNSLSPFVTVRKFLSKCLNEVGRKLNYTKTTADHSFGFYCNFKHDNTMASRDHLAICSDDASHTYCSITPSRTAVLRTEEQIWFDGNSAMVATNTEDCSSSCSTKPSVGDWSDYLESLIDWEKFAIYLPGIEQSDVDRISKDETGVENRKIALWKKWTTVNTSATWNDVIGALKRMKEFALADDIEKKLLKKLQ